MVDGRSSQCGTLMVINVPQGIGRLNQIYHYHYYNVLQQVLLFLLNSCILATTREYCIH